MKNEVTANHESSTPINNEYSINIHITKMYAVLHNTFLNSFQIGIV